MLCVTVGILCTVVSMELLLEIFVYEKGNYWLGLFSMAIVSVVVQGFFRILRVQFFHIKFKDKLEQWVETITFASESLNSCLPFLVIGISSNNSIDTNVSRMVQFIYTPYYARTLLMICPTPSLVAVIYD